jgi:uncharacterized membrane protein
MGLQWVVTLAGLGVSRVFTFFMAFLAYSTAKKAALVTAYIVASAALFLTMAGAIKAIVIGARYAMPSSLASFTYFLPSSINFLISSIVMVKTTHYVWRWTQKNLASYAMTFGEKTGYM